MPRKSLWTLPSSGNGQQVQVDELWVEGAGEGRGAKFKTISSRRTSRISLCALAAIRSGGISLFQNSVSRHQFSLKRIGITRREEGPDWNKVSPSNKKLTSN
ncbi:hypothetical protein Salat_1333900 [Sesamum alatum]|uniref:Uncharacterized protein n=1 Tax=Sesamum alatum TaxID=300844 RepID=A0AAE1YHW5_9LAMI|nr:hypothetical protein Salat_1333900 [Sesamum alatum]